jgi:hypothetical protein
LLHAFKEPVTEETVDKIEKEKILHQLHGVKEQGGKISKETLSVENKNIEKI